jgi:thioesterase domain-containing protein
LKPFELQEFLHQQIPMARALEVGVTGLSADSVELLAPLNPNCNHMGTAFGGSLGAMMILACYAWLFNRLGEEGKHCHVLIQSAHTDYLKPVTGDIRARCLRSEEIERVMEQFERKGVARVVLHSEVVDPAGVVLCKFSGEFVARRK